MTDFQTSAREILKTYNSTHRLGNDEKYFNEALDKLTALCKQEVRGANKSRTGDIEIASRLLLEYLKWAKSVGQNHGVIGAALYRQWLTDQLRVANRELTTTRGEM